MAEALTVADVLLDVRDLNPTFDRRRHPDAVVLRFLSRYQVEMLNRIAQIKRDAVRSVFEAEIPTEDDWEDGERIPEYLLVHGGNVIFTDATIQPEPLVLVPFGDRLEGRRWGAYLQGRDLRFLGIFSDWADVERVDVYYFPKGEVLTARTSEFELPGTALPVLVAAAGAFLARRKPEEVTVDGFAKEQEKAELLYLDEVTGRRRATVGSMRECW